MEFHISRKARLTYQFDESLFQISGNVIFANFHASRVFAQRMNEKRDVIHFPEKAIRAGQLNAMGLIDEVLHYVIYLYRQEKNKDVLREAEEFLTRSVGKKKLQSALEMFVDEFPPLKVFAGEISVKEYLDNQTEGVPNRQLVLEELIMLWIANMNPALAPFLELFDDEQLEKLTAYNTIMGKLHEFFQDQPVFGPDNEILIEMLRSPAITEPYSLSGQLDYIRRKWGFMLGSFFYRLLRSLDLIQEEEKARMFVPGAAHVYEFGKLEGEIETERFSPDKDWMPRVVLLAKSTYVWLDQLSKKYKRSITRLDQIPDEELNQLAGWGFTGLWLIGLWERSRASQRIKQLCGNPEAVASAYSLMNYGVAGDLGGEEAFQNLRERAWKRGIRMGGDMVPNHMGIDSNWIMEHPDWFVQLNYCPFPSYTFNGVNLSWDDSVGIYLEDHYYSRNDAAVVFKRVDHHTGHTRFIYHGNDGTSMPWNDTAQLNYLNPDVREAVIQTILDVAKKFPIIRFDAAMTLTKKHYQRLWFPEPGSGGDIPTRAEHGLTRSQFDEAMPEEFWREVVDRVAQEVPDTLLLAEAFWLMEGYFVRTLGMHRVYNSAFMNMLKNEHNDKYRSSIKNILEFNPEILKRFVNFMNNPDEATAVAQFGKGDKYMGVCTMLVTMPGLPMFGHGQIEGFTEKYGMEYHRAYWDEQADQDLVRRHERQIFPLMKKRYVFADVKNFFL
ncbi:MAG: alpha-amylase, partial [Calditrichaeota bacterium]